MGHVRAAYNDQIVIFSCDVPEGVDVRESFAHGQGALESVIQSAIEEQHERTMNERALSDDVGLQEWLDWRCAGQAGPSHPVVRAVVYAGRTISSDQEMYERSDYIPQPTFARDDPRRPVFMKGSKHTLNGGGRGHRGHKGYWVERVAARFLRVTKYTCSSRSDHDWNMKRINDWASKRGFHFRAAALTNGTGSDAFFVGVDRWKEHGYWRGGVHYCDSHQPAPARAPRKSITPEIMIETRKTKERAILRAVHELGLVQPGDGL